MFNRGTPKEEQLRLLPSNDPIVVDEELEVKDRRMVEKPAYPDAQPLPFCKSNTQLQTGPIRE